MPIDDANHSRDESGNDTVEHPNGDDTELLDQNNYSMETSDGNGEDIMDEVHPSVDEFYETIMTRMTRQVNFDQLASMLRNMDYTIMADYILAWCERERLYCEVILYHIEQLQEMLNLQQSKDFDNQPASI